MASNAEDVTFRERTLATQYQPRQQLPPNFASVLKEYAREVLRAQPDDILTWSAAYFKRLALETDQLQAKQPPPGHYTPVIEDATREVVAQRVVKVLAQLDAVGAGVLPLSVVRRALYEHFGLTHAQTLYLLSADDAGVREAEGVVAYETFAYASVAALQFFEQTKYDFAADATAAAAEARRGGNDGHSRDAPHDKDDAMRADCSDEAAAVHGHSRSDVEYYFLRTFRLVDESGTGRVLFADYRNALVNAPLHLTRRDIRVVCLECERSGDKDDVDYEAEVAQLYDRLLLSHRFDRLDRGDDDDDDGGRAGGDKYDDNNNKDKDDDGGDDGYEDDGGAAYNNGNDDAVAHAYARTPSA